MQSDRLLAADQAHVVVNTFKRPIQRYAHNLPALFHTEDGEMIVRTSCHRQTKLFGVAIGSCVFVWMIAGIGAFYAIAVQVAKADMADIIPLAEGMGLYNAAAVAAHFFQLLAARPMFHLGMGQQPCLVKAVDEVFVIVVILFPAEKHIKADFLSLGIGVLISGAEDVHPLFPAAFARDAAVAVHEMIGDDDTLEADGFIVARLLSAGGCGAGAALDGMQMRFVQIRHVEPSLCGYVDNSIIPNCRVQASMEFVFISGKVCYNEFSIFEEDVFHGLPYLSALSSR